MLKQQKNALWIPISRIFLGQSTKPCENASRGRIGGEPPDNQHDSLETWANWKRRRGETFGIQHFSGFRNVSLLLEVPSPKRNPRNNAVMKISTKQKSHVSSRNYLPTLNNWINWGSVSVGFVVVWPNRFFHPCSELKDQAELEPNKEDNQIINLLTEARHSLRKTWWLVEMCACVSGKNDEHRNRVWGEQRDGKIFAKHTWRCWFLVGRVSVEVFNHVHLTSETWKIDTHHKRQSPNVMGALLHLPIGSL